MTTDQSIGDHERDHVHDRDHARDHVRDHDADADTFALPALPPPTASTRTSGVNPVTSFVDRIVQGEPLYGNAKVQAKRLDVHYAMILADELRPSAPPPPPPPSSPFEVGVYVDTDALDRNIATLTQQVALLEGECTRAHDWRFHLESHMREVRTGLLYFRDTAKRSPTLEEYSGLLDALRAGIAWTPNT